MDLNSLPYVPCQHRTRRTQATRLLVIHTNEGPEGVNSAEGLANYLQHAPNGAGYNLVVDENSAVELAKPNELVWGAGGVNSVAYHICLTGYAAQSVEQWNDPPSQHAIAIAAQLLHQAALVLRVPLARVTDTRDGGPRGVCGHGDVSKYHSQSMGHTDPGPNFPWDRLFTQQEDGEEMTKAQELLLIAAARDAAIAADAAAWACGVLMPGGYAGRTPKAAEQLRADIAAIRKAVAPPK